MWHGITHCWPCLCQKWHSICCACRTGAGTTDWNRDHHAKWMIHVEILAKFYNVYIFYRHYVHVNTCHLSIPSLKDQLRLDFRRSTNWNKDAPFAVKIATFHTPSSPGPPKRSKFHKFLDLENFSLELAFNITGHGENTPYSSSELNESDIVNRQSGVRNWNIYLKFA